MPTPTTPPAPVVREIIDYYTHTFAEADRLTATADGRLEMLRTQEILRRHLPSPPARVLDIGGGPGAHAHWLMADGYTVHLIDPVPLHIEQATEQAGCTAELGDARHLTAADGSYDVVLLFGPLYHLLEPEDRMAALREAARVVCPGGLVAAAAIGRYASLFEHTATTLLGRDNVRNAVADILATGRHEPGRKGFTAAYFHTADELAEEMCAAGLVGVRVHSVEGPTWGLLKAAEQHTGEQLNDGPMFDAALHAARLAEPYPDLLAASSHMLATATA
jgi:SAM-dependent methyltransferase